MARAQRLARVVAVPGGIAPTMAAKMGIRAIVPTNQRIGWRDSFAVTMDMTVKMTANAVTIVDFRRDRLNARIGICAQPR
jgi:hypothetical protein